MSTIYLAEFSTQTRRISESWADYSVELRRLATKAYPDMDTKVTEQIALSPILHIANSLNTNLQKH